MPLKTFLTLLLSISFAINAIGQMVYPDSGFTNKKEAKNLMVNELKEGKWVEYYRNYNTGSLSGIKLKKHQFLHTRHYHLVVYKAGKPYGIDRQYESGKLFCVTPYNKNGRKNGMEIYYFNDGTISHERMYKNDTLNGVMNFYAENGQLLDEGYYIMNKQISDTSFYKTGKLKEVGLDSNGKWIVKQFIGDRKFRTKTITIPIDSTHFLVMDYDADKNLIGITPCTVNEENGLHREYYKNGKLKSEINYKNGIRNGVEVDYNPNGVLWKECNNADGKVHGEYKEYYPDGKLAIQAIYKHGKLKTIKNYDENGNEIK